MTGSRDEAATDGERLPLDRSPDDPRAGRRRFLARAAALACASPIDGVVADGTPSPADAPPPAAARPADEPPSAYVPAPVTPLRVAPGLEGFGTTTAAGRGGQVLVVSTLASDGPGSYAHAMATPGPRQILFDVAGVITMPPRGLRIAHGQVSVFGQSARGTGVEFRADPTDGHPNTLVQSSDVLFQHVRFRTGPGPASREGGWPARDSLNVGSTTTPVSRVVLDHVSASWGTDEIADFWGGSADITVSNSLFYENLHSSTDDFSTSGRAVFFSDRCRRISFHRSVIAVGTGRMPMMQGVFDFDVFNNLVHGYTKTAFEAQVTSDVAVRGRVEHNLFVDALDGRAEIAIYPKARGGKGDYRVAIGGNGRQRGGPGAAIEDVRVTDAVGGGTVEATPEHDPRDPPRPARVPLEALERELLARVGASAPARDAADERIVRAIRERAGALVDCVDEQVETRANRRCARNVASPSLASGPSRLGPAPDFVPPDWKRANGLAPDADARATDSNDDGYLDIEDWLADLAAGGTR